MSSKALPSVRWLNAKALECMEKGNSKVAEEYLSTATGEIISRSLTANPVSAAERILTLNNIAFCKKTK